MRFDVLKRIKPERSLMGALLLGLVLSVGAGGEESDKEKRPPRWVRILAVGDSPPYRQEFRDGVAHQVKAPPGSVPPREVTVALDEETSKEAGLRLGAISSPLAVPAGARPLPIFPGKGADLSSKPWQRLNLPEEGHVLAIFWRGHNQKTWDDARHLVLPDDPADFGAGKVRLVNVTPYRVAIALDGKKFDLKPGVSMVRAGGNAKGVELRVAVADQEGRLRTIYSSSLVQNRGERANIVIYRADGESPRRPAKVLLHRESARLPPIPVEKEERGGPGS